MLVFKWSSPSDNGFIEETNVNKIYFKSDIVPLVTQELLEMCDSLLLDKNVSRSIVKTTLKARIFSISSKKTQIEGTHIVFDL